MKLDTTHEPVRLAGWSALAVGLVLNGLILWSAGANAEVIVGALATMAVTSIGGLEFARSKVTPTRRDG